MSTEKKYRKVELYKDYFEKFFAKQDKKTQEKIVWTLELIEDLDRIPVKFLKHVEEELYEIRVKQGTNIFRIFSFFDEGKLIVLANGFKKKTNKLPKSEITKAKRIMIEYFESKNDKG